MKRTSPRHARILGVYPYRRGFGFAILEDFILIDWGLARLRTRSEEEFRARVESLVHQYRVTGIAVEDSSNRRRSIASLERVESVVSCARRLNLSVNRLSRAAVFSVFGLDPKQTNHTLSRLLSQYFPELDTVLPPPRRFFDNEDERVNVFRAAALAGAAMVG